MLASGSGTILESMLDSGLDVAVVGVDRACRATEVAADHRVVTVIEERSFGSDFDRAAYTDQWTKQLVDHGIDLIVMAGFGTILGPSIYGHFAGQILNTHPSLLPSFPGWHAVDAALEYGVKVTGCTVHVAELEVDSGPILAQAAVDVLPGDTAESLHERIKVVERHLYLDTITTIIDRGWVLEKP